MVMLIGLLMTIRANAEQVGYVASAQTPFYMQKADSKLITGVDAAEKAWIAATTGTAVSEGDRLKTGANGLAVIKFTDGSQIKLNSNTVITIKTQKGQKGILSKIKVNLGKIWCNITSPRTMEMDIETPAANATIRGTEFEISVDNNETTLDVYNGAVQFHNEFGSVDVAQMQESTAKVGQAPTAPITISVKERRWFNKYIINVERERISTFKTNDDMGNARKEAQAALDKNPNDGKALSVMGQISMIDGKFDDAKNYFDKAIQNNYKDAQVFLGLGELALLDGDKEKALLYFQNAKDLSPDDPAVLSRYTDGLISAEDYSGAENLLKNKLDINLQLKLGYAYLMDKKVDEAENTFKEILQKDPNNMDAVTYLAIIYKSKGKIDEANQLFEKISLTKDAKPEFKFAMAEYYINHDRFDEANNILTELKNDPNPVVAAQANFYLGLLAYDLYKFKDALKYFKEANRLNPNEAVSLAYLANAKYQLDDVKGAYDDVKRSIEIDPYLESPRRFLFFFYGFQAKYLQAMNEVDKVIAVDPDNPLLYFFKGVTADALYSFEVSHNAYKQYDDKIKELQNAGYYEEIMDYYLGSYYYNTGNLNKALKYFTKAIERSPFGLYYSLRASTYKKLNQYKGAQEDAFILIKMAPDFVAGYSKLGEIYDAMGRVPEEEQAYIKAVLVQSTNANAHDKLGYLYLAEGNYPSALSETQLALTLYMDQLNEQGADGARANIQSILSKIIDY